MIEIKFTFASIAAAALAIAAVERAERGAGVDLSTHASTGVAPDEKAAVVAAADAVAKAKDTPAKPKGTPAAKTPPAADSQPSAATAQTAASDPKKVAYPDLQKAVFALVGQAKKANLDPTEHVLSIAVGLGAPTFKELPEEQWGPALAAVEAKAAELAAA